MLLLIILLILLFGAAAVTMATTVGSPRRRGNRAGYPACAFAGRLIRGLTLPLKEQFMSVSVLFLVIAIVLFALGSWSRWWAAQQPYYPTFISGGLFFWALSQLWPILAK